MKRIYFKITALLLMVIIASCQKSPLPVLATNLSGTEAQIKFFNFGINSPSINFYAGADKISAVLSATGAENAAGTVYGSVFPALNYSVLSPGAYTFTGVVPSTAATNPGVVVASVAGNLAASSFSSLYTCGFYNATTKTTDAFVISDALPPVDGNAYVRFVNTIPNGTAGINLAAGNTLATPTAVTTIATNIAYKASSGFVAVPIGVYEFYASYASAPGVTIFSRVGTSAVTLLAGHAYTVSSRGDITVSATGTATNRPFLDVSTNR